MKRTLIQSMVTHAYRPWRHTACLATLALSLVGLPPTANADYASTVQGFSPVGYWRLNETAVDEAINSGTSGTAVNGLYFNGTLHGSEGALVGSSATAASLDGNAKKIQIPWSAALNAGSAGLADPFTVEAWVKSNGAPSGSHIIIQSMRQPGQLGTVNTNPNDRSGWFLREQGSDLLFAVGTPTGAPFYYYYTVAGVVSPTAWQHIVVVYDGDDTPTIYVDGVEQTYVVTKQNGAAFDEGEQAAIRVLQNTDFPELIGDRGFGGWVFNGSIDEVAIYPSALNSITITAHYDNGLDAGRTTPYETLVGTSNPAGYWRLDEPAFVQPTAVNIGSLATAADGAYSLGTFAKAAGPPSTAGLGAGNFACLFDGTGQILCGNDTGLNLTEISIAAWIKVGTKVADMNVLAKGSSLWRLQLDGTTNHLKWVCPGGGVIGTRNVADGLWHYVVAVAGANGSALYVDGEVDQSNPTAVPALPANTDPVAIGSQNAAAARWNGTLDEVALFGGELTEANVLALYLAAEPPFGNDMITFGPGATISGTSITWMVPYGTDVTNLSPTYTVSPLAAQDASFPSGSGRDFTTPQTYTITSYDNVPKTYTVTVTLSAGGLLVSTYDSTYGTAYLNPISNLMAVSPSATGVQYTNIDYGDFLALPGITSTDSFAVLWETWLDVTKEGTGDYTFGTTSDDGSAVYLDLNDDGDFTDPGELVVNNNVVQPATTVTGTVALTMPSVRMLIGYFEDGGGEAMAARFNKGSGLAWAALQPINGTTGHFFPVSLAGPKEITSFAIAPYGEATFMGTDISLVVTNDEPVTALTPTIIFDGESLSPASGVTQDFTNPVIYTVTASDGATRAYTVRVTSTDLPVGRGLIVRLRADAVDPNDDAQVRVSGSDTFVKQWNDLSGNAHNATNATEADQPMYIASGVNGKPVLRFAQDSDDNGDRLYLGDLSASFPTAGSLFTVGRIDNDGRYNLFGNRNSGDERWVADSWAESHPGSFRTDRANGTFTQGSWPKTGSHVFALESNSAVYRVLIDGTEVGSDTPQYNNGSGADWTIANRAPNGQQLRGDIPEVILYNRVLTPAEAYAVGGYLAEKYAVTTTYPPTNATAPYSPTAASYDAAVALTWYPFLGATSYNVKRSLVSGGPYTPVGTPTENAFTNTGLTNGTPYYYVISAVTDAGESLDSVEVSATPLPVDPGVSTVVASPTTLLADGIAQSTITVTLKNASGNPLSGKNVSVAKTGGSAGTPIVTPASVTSGADGKAVFTVTSTDVGAFVFTATDTTSPVTLSTKPTIAFVTAPPAPSPPPVAGYSRWFEPSQVLLTNTGDPVTVWLDASGNGADATVPGGNATPTYVADAGTGTGLGAVYFPKNGGANASGALRFTRDSGIRTVFSVFKGNSFLLTDTDAYHFHRPGDDNPADALWSGDASDRIRNGSTYVNGVLVNGTSFNMPTTLNNGFNLVEVLATDTVQADSFNKDRIFHAGDQYQGEVIIYDFLLTEEQRLAVEQYLMDKWFIPTYDIVTFGSNVAGSSAIITTTSPTTGTIAWTVPPATDVTTLGPNYAVTFYAREDALYPSGTVRDFTTPQTYTITSADLTSVTKTYTVTAIVGAPPANDNFVDAIGLPGKSGIQTGTGNVYATLETGELGTVTYPGGGTSLFSNTVWFKWTCPADGNLTLNTLGSRNVSGSEWDGVVGVYTGDSVDALTPLPGTPQDTGLEEIITVPVTAGTTYHIQMAGYENSVAANIRLTWTFVGTGGYDAWATQYAGGQTAGEDYNNDGVQNGIAYFMGMNGIATNPGVVGGKVTWPRVGVVSSFEVQVSNNLTAWEPATSGVDTSDPGQVVFTLLPSATPKKFCRLVVTP